MSNHSTIDWTDSTWNPVTGCTEVSPGCDHCYAKTFAERFRGIPGHPYEQGFDVKLWPDRLLLPQRWKKPRKIFVNSMSDLFHKEVPSTFILDVFAAMTRADHHIYQVLTKRPSRLINTSLTGKILERVYDLTGNAVWPQHIWLGVSVENQEYTWRVDALRHVAAPVRFISAEPLLGPLQVNMHDIAWLIAGAESGHGARSMDEDWVRLLRDQCLTSGCAFFYKQQAINGRKIHQPTLDGRQWIEYPVVGEKEATL